MNSKAPTIPVLHIRIRINCIRIFNIIFFHPPDGNGNLRLRTDDNSERIFFPVFNIKSNESGEKQSQPIFRIFHNSRLSVCLRVVDASVQSTLSQ